MERLRFSTPLGFDLGSVNLKKKLEKSGRYDEFGNVSYDELINILSTKLAEPINFGHTFEKFEEDLNGVTAYFKEGHKEHSDLLVGCDGVFSTVRNQLFGHHKPKYSGMEMWYGTSNYTDPHQNGVTNWRFGSDQSLSYYGFGKDSKQTALVFFRKNPQQVPEPRNLEGDKKELLQILKKDHIEPVHQIVEGCSSLKHFGLYSHESLPQWHTGRVTLLGDACHPTIPIFGKGVDLAVEDAFVLTLALVQHHGHRHGNKKALESYWMKRHSVVEHTLKDQESWIKFGAANGTFLKNIRTYLSIRTGGMTKNF